VSDNKTNTANQAKAALGLTPEEITTRDQWWVDVLSQLYRTVLEAALDQRNLKKIGTARLRFAQASALCDALVIYFRHVGLNETADLWTERSVLCHRQAFVRENTIARSIGASMP
jgi:hypothetical protein